MRRFLAVASAVVLFQAASLAQADDFSFNINVGGPPVVLAQAPDFLYPPELGFGVAVGVPYDLFYCSGIYYVYRGGGWYSTPTYGGAWRSLRPRELPPELRRYKIARIHAFRDREFRSYARDRDHYRGKYFRPGREGRAEHREIKELKHEERQDMREQRHDEREQRQDEREQRRDEHRDDKR